MKNSSVHTTRRRFRVSPVGVLVAVAWFGVMAAGCHDVLQGANPEAPIWRHRPGGALSLTRQEPLSVVTRRTGEAYEHGRPVIDAAHNRVFVGSSDRGLYALRAQDGAQLWRFEAEGPVQGEPLYDERTDTLFFGSDDGALYKVRAADGKLLWRFMSNAEIWARPVLVGSKLLFANANDTLMCVNAQTGETLWSRHRPPIGGMAVAGYAGPTVWRDKVFFAYSDGNVMAYRIEDGAQVWEPVDLSASIEQDSASGVPSYFDVDTTPVVDEGPDGPVVFVAAYAGGVFALDANTGAQVWSQPRARGVTALTLWSQPAHRPRDGGPTVPARKLLIASSGTSGVWALDPRDGSASWHHAANWGGVSKGVPMVGALLVSTSNHGLFLLSALDGGVIDGVDLGMTYSMAPAVYGTRAFLLSDGGSWLTWHVTPPPGVMRHLAAR